MDCSLVVDPDREETSGVRIEDMGIQPKARPDVPSQQMTEFAGLRGDKAPKEYPCDNLEATVCQTKGPSSRLLTCEKGKRSISDFIRVSTESERKVRYSGPGPSSTS